LFPGFAEASRLVWQLATRTDLVGREGCRSRRAQRLARSMQRKVHDSADTLMYTAKRAGKDRVIHATAGQPPQ
jgi:hypothetical protein